MTERTREDWGRVAVSLPGWRWMPGMLQRRRTGPCMGSRRSVDSDYFHTGHEARVMAGNTWPDPDDPANVGCFLTLLGGTLAHVLTESPEYVVCIIADGDTWEGEGVTLGRACIAAAEALGRWPGGAA